MQRVTPTPKQTREAPKTVVFIGDSVVFGSGLPDNLVLSNIVATEMPDIQFLNYGVPGYNLNDYEKILKNMEPENVDLVVLQLTPNDITIAVAGFLGLLYTDDDTIVRFNEFSDNFFDRVKLALQKYWKSAYVLGVMSKRSLSNNKSMTEIDGLYKEFSGTKCIEDIAKDYEKGSKEFNQFLDVAYRDDEAGSLFASKLVKTVEFIENQLKAKVIVIPNFGFHTLNNQNISGFAEMFRSPKMKHFSNQFFDPDYHSAWIECGFFADNGHPGEFYNKNLSVDLIPMIKMYTSTYGN